MGHFKGDVNGTRKGEGHCKGAGKGGIRREQGRGDFGEGGSEEEVREKLGSGQVRVSI